MKFLISMSDVEDEWDTLPAAELFSGLLHRVPSGRGR